MLQTDAPSMVKFLFSGDEEEKEKEKETNQSDKDPEFRVDVRLHAILQVFVKFLDQAFVGQDRYSNHILEILTPPPERGTHSLCTCG